MVHHAFPDNFPVKIPLFISREQAKAYRRCLKDGQRYKVYGMAQYKLRGFLAGALLRNMPIGLVFDYPEPGGTIRLHAIDAARINCDFLLEPIVQPAPPGPMDRLKTVVKGLVPARRRR